jgi:hypothetical protein
VIVAARSLAKLERRDWALIRKLAEAVLAASSQDDDGSESSAEKRLLAELGKLDQKYGQHPVLLATRADYTRSVRQQQALLRRAYRLAWEANLGDELWLIAHSMAESYLEARDTAAAQRWLENMKRALQRFPDANGLRWLRDLSAEIQRLVNKSRSASRRRAGRRPPRGSAVSFQRLPGSQRRQRTRRDGSGSAKTRRD